MYEFVKEYIRGCATCQENKILTRRNKPVLYPIPPEEDAKPFQTVAMDLIVKLSTSNRYDLILTVTGSRERVWEHPLDRGKLGTGHYVLLLMCLDRACAM